MPVLVGKKPDEVLQTLHGRKVQTKNEVYFLPADSPEMERLSRQHKMFHKALDSLYWPLAEIREVLAPRNGEQIRILDVGSGSGAWAVEMAKEFPHAEVIGIDLFPIKPSNTPSNCRFECADAVADSLASLGKFDFVHSRLIGGGIRGYQPYLKKIVNTLKYGGLFSCIEGDLVMYDDKKEPVNRGYEGQKPGTGSWFARITGEHQDRNQTMADYPPSPGYSIPKWLSTDDRLGDAMSRKVFTPIGWPGANDNDIENREEVGKLMGENCLEITKAFRPSLLKAGVSEREIDLWIAENEVDVLRTRIKIYTQWHYCTIKAKPLASSN